MRKVLHFHCSGDANGNFDEVEAAGEGSGWMSEFLEG